MAIVVRLICFEGHDADLDGHRVSQPALRAAILAGARWPPETAIRTSAALAC